MKVLIRTLFVMLALSGLSVFAQDNGNADTMAFEVTIGSGGPGAPRLVQVELWGYLDAANWVSATSGFHWTPTEMTLDSATFSGPATTAFNFIHSVFRGDSKDTSNTYDQFIFGAARISGNGLAFAAARQLLATYWFSIGAGTALSDSITFDTNAYNGGATYKVIRSNNVAHFPVWKGRQALVNPLDVASNGDGTLPGKYSLDQNYPNPFNPKTTINFALPEKTNVTLRIYNMLGQSVNDVVDQEMSAGNYSVEWDGRDRSGNAVASGVYFYRLETNKFTQTRKMMFLK